MSTTEKGNSLEDQVYDYLLDQVSQKALVFDLYPHHLCEVHKKKKYYCSERGRDVEFDVVIEVRQTGRSEPHIVVLFECKNHKAPVQERDITDFSDKIGRIFRHSAKGLIVSSSRLQSGAENLAKSRRLGIVKFDENGVDIIADRASGIWAEQHFVKTQILPGSPRTKSLKFSGVSDGRYFGSLRQLMESLSAKPANDDDISVDQKSGSVEFLSEAEIQASAENALSLTNYLDGEVNLAEICNALSLALSFSDRVLKDADGNTILGSAKFEQRAIEINRHNNPNRERFTIAHEIGHFCLKHDRYLRSESIVERDLNIDGERGSTFNYVRLESQANRFASKLLMPDHQFRRVLEVQRKLLDIKDRGFGYIFVDNQPCNYIPYYRLLTALSDHFGASKQAVEIRLKRAGFLTDRRKNGHVGDWQQVGAAH